MPKFKAEIKLIGINPFVFVPEEILALLFKKFGKDKGPIPIKGSINGLKYRQTLVRYRGEWRLYVNTSMLPNSPQRIGETIDISINIDFGDRTIQPHPLLVKALTRNSSAREKFQSLTPSLRKEIVRYISLQKTEASVVRNVERAIRFLLGKESFVGRKRLE